MFGMYSRTDPRAIVPLLLVMVLMGFLFACAAANPIAAAETLEQKAFALYGTFVVFEEQGAALVESGQIGSSTARAIIDADERAKPVADDLLDATLELAAIRAEFLAGGETSTERFVNAMNNLNNWVERADPLVTNLRNSVEGARR